MLISWHSCDGRYYDAELSCWDVRAMRSAFGPESTWTPAELDRAIALGYVDWYKTTQMPVPRQVMIAVAN